MTLTVRARGTTGGVSWTSVPPAGFVRNLMLAAITSHMVQSSIANTASTTQSPPTVGGQQTSHDGSTNAGQSTQARYD